jgi:small subunit ribosomal protein S20
MPIIKSAKKRVRVAKKATVRNSKTKRSLKSAIKAFHAAVTGGKKTAEALDKAQSELDKAVKKGIMHKNKAARKKKQLATTAKAAGGAKKSPTPKKKPATKKTTSSKK